MGACPEHTEKAGSGAASQSELSAPLTCHLRVTSLCHAREPGWAVLVLGTDLQAAALLPAPLVFLTTLGMLQSSGPGASAVAANPTGGPVSPLLSPHESDGCLCARSPQVQGKPGGASAQEVPATRTLT